MMEDITIEDKIELRKKQWELAMDGDVRMLIWLGKQYLGQKDNPVTAMNKPISGIEFIDDLDRDDEGNILI
jgi:hypothetical protein